MNSSTPSDNPTTGPSGTDRGNSDHDANSRDKPDITTTAARLAEVLHNTVPTALIPYELREFVHREANARLDAARAAGVSLDQVTIGDDCLPTWPGELEWDSNEESLHVNLQNRLVDWDVARELGDLVCGDIVSKGRLKLARARALGLDLRDVYIGRSLLPEWTLGQADVDDEQHGEEVDADEANVPDNYIAVDDDDDDDSDMDTVVTLASRRSSGETTYTPLTDVFDSQLSAAPNNSPVSACESDSSAEWDDVIALNNFVLPQPEYEEPDDDDDEDDLGDLNVAHDVEVVGGASGSTAEFDLKVYVVGDNDEDISHLTEVELAIDDGDAYVYHFGDDAAVDVELPPGCGFSFAGVEEPDDDDEPLPPRRTRVQPLPLFDDDDGEEEEDIYSDDRVGRAVLGVVEEVSSEHSEEETDWDEDDDGDDGEHDKGGESNTNGEGEEDRE
ncbi:acyltransferase [Purpureocillium lavendulum]|uniref:Acyltransferase n=1 Tax=Purpureocillium lavendulum TaxID=1247861 RepID=A0AB34FS25_9HYPO|nr:acyltransferase [Purpureocillium lavendulum]